MAKRYFGGRVGVRRSVNISRVVSKVAITLIALWVGGTILDSVGDVMNGTCSPFYQGLTLIGWTVDGSNCITDTAGSGILGVVGIVGLASIVMEFVEIRM